MSTNINDLFRLDGRVAVITGGTRGIGRAIAEGFVAAGANVVVASRKQDAVDDTVAAITAHGGSAVGMSANLGDLEAIDRLAALAVETYGQVDIVVNNAATALAQPLGQFTGDAWDKVFAVDTKGPVFLVQALMPQLIASPHASVINVISAGAFIPTPYQSMYGAAKAALLSFTRSMAAELAPHGVRVNALAPGPVDTDMVRNTGEESMGRMANAVMQKRIAPAFEMIGPALFLASDASSFVTGQCVVADGGLVAAR